MIREIIALCIGMPVGVALALAIIIGTLAAVSGYCDKRGKK